MNNNLQTAFGNIDIYLFDQLLKGRFDACKKVIDVGCGAGRNIVYFLKNGYEVYGIDPNADAIASVKQLSQELQPGNPVENFMVAAAEQMSFDDASFDLAICSAVLHFAADPVHFDSMMRSIWRVLKPGGYLFARLASDIGIETLVKPVGNGRYLLPDGSVRFLVNEQMLVDYTEKLGGTLYEPIKTTNVSNMRCMTTWCIKKM
ncbi:MAG: SAM-dependent methyltransferase [Flavipsychrobacter sp.]|nr:SAM-dependent methyltransferase [Flavipsychrobacter sp.]